MTYKGYTAQVTVDEDAGLIHGRVVGLRDVVSFQAESVSDLHAAFREAVDDYLSWCEELGEEPERPYSGRLLLRMDPSLHRDVAMRAERAGVSINKFIVAKLGPVTTKHSLPTSTPASDVKWHRSVNVFTTRGVLGADRPVEQQVEWRDATEAIRMQLSL
jgi:predicted HicB family RNase H-like nuclease